ncbi:MAG: hypothetical protein A2186_00400 [Candidatus Levybacteria bacterium RIFOXYA1_FULL_41_10]|nr:MAG: Rhodanese domain protein [Candidatus Levybacteria bacterium GW2011_GWA1_39_32]KKR50908.1 MAG: Rhodanese domain protein [Candidatus Levybacteria bacterium GW2011_GWC1_40_19]KKR73169.1 MAG: Rhodanese domain protein [Candidatus Levybacteria bacterium GW2011_GWC2_40_7]KKR94060.1 MAG: Rhodanese domain protein [Candidatus Levybacteria bacterium GW2011_GWA2_41_15]KKS01181.1 MAG: Rhodanese domain protein [Candidatus Levybacteria bacterium GW2011_GWB1_41_21]OGH21131.1 MAG: hypothetical protein 
MKTKIAIGIIVLSIFILGGLLFSIDQKENGASNKPAQSLSFKTITSPELVKMLEKKDFLLVNVHIPYERELVKTDVFIPYNEIENNLDKLPQDKNAKIVLYCRSGRMSEEAAQTLTKLGYANVYNHTGGMIDWEDKGYSVLRK